MGWSRDSWSWTLNANPAYNSSIEWAGEGGTDILLSRQRPKILFDEKTGDPMFLYNGAEARDRPGRQFTLATPFQGASWVL